MRSTAINVCREAFTFRPLPMLLIMITFMVATATGCRRSVNEQSRSVIVSAPANGVVRRVIVDAAAAVDKDAAIIEIAVQPEHAGAANPPNTDAAQAQAAHAQTDLASAEGEANRIAADLRRIEPLVKRGLASKAELDKARSQSLDAQQRLRLAWEKAKSTESKLNQVRSAANEEILVVRAPAAGTVQAVNVQAGQVVVIGQPLATLVSNT